MKKYSFFLLGFALCLNIFNANAQSLGDNNRGVKGPAITFDQPSIDLGNSQIGIFPSRSFKFINDGTEPLLISNLKTSEGCTVIGFPKKPIPPGKKGSIEVTCKIRKVGNFKKKIILTTNAQNGPNPKNPGIIELQIKGNRTK